MDGREPHTHNIDDREIGYEWLNDSPTFNIDGTDSEYGWLNESHTQNRWRKGWLREWAWTAE